MRTIPQTRMILYAKNIFSRTPNLPITFLRHLNTVVACLFGIGCTSAHFVRYSVRTIRKHSFAPESGPTRSIPPGGSINTCRWGQITLYNLNVVPAHKLDIYFRYSKIFRIRLNHAMHFTFQCRFHFFPHRNSHLDTVVIFRVSGGLTCHLLNLRLISLVILILMWLIRVENPPTLHIVA